MLPLDPGLALMASGGLAGSGSTCREAAVFQKAGPCPSCCRTAAHLSGGVWTVQAQTTPPPRLPRVLPLWASTGRAADLGPWSPRGPLATRSPPLGTARRQALPAPGRGGRGRSTGACAPHRALSGVQGDFLFEDLRSLWNLRNALLIKAEATFDPVSPLTSCNRKPVILPHLPDGKKTSLGGRPLPFHPILYLESSVPSPLAGGGDE